jgi:Zn-dependent protease with chaperone function
MRKIRLIWLSSIAIILFSCTTTYNVSKDHIINTTNSYSDLPEYSDDYSVFWQYIIIKNAALNNYENDNSRFARKCKKNFGIETFNLSLHSITTNTTALSIMKNLCGSTYANYLKNIAFYSSNDLNAYALPNGEIYLSNSLMDLLNTDEITGVIAHEIAHVMLKHTEVSYFNYKKQEKKDNTAAAITAAFAGVAIVGSQIAVAKNGSYTEEVGNSFNQLTNNTISAIDNGFTDNTILHKYKYSREQEMEADIVACLFLKWTGKNPESHIQGLSKIFNFYNSVFGNLYPNTISLYDSHPSLQFRISTLKSLFSK